jgi:hypothetical protein
LKLVADATNGNMLLQFPKSMTDEGEEEKEVSPLDDIMSLLEFDILIAKTAYNRVQCIKGPHSLNTTFIGLFESCLLLQRHDPN